MPHDQACAELQRMLDTVRHETFYRTGTWTDETTGVYVGWVARENSFSDGMPVVNETRDLALAFSGEEYPDPAVMRRLRERGHEFAAGGPDYLIHLYEEDKSFPKCLNGRFHGLVTDTVRHTAALFNDRYGMARLYYHMAPEAFYFAAEAKAILAVRPELRRADWRSVGEFVGCGCVLDNRTLFDGISVLPPGSVWEFESGKLKKKGSYFDPAEWENQSELSPEEYYGQICETFSRNLPRYLNGKERVGVSLTGGLDTRTVMAWQRFKHGSLPCYTYGEAGRDCRDVTVAREVARACGQPHQVITLGEEFLSRFGQYAERSIYLTDGCVDVTRTPDLYLSERAREIAPVRLTGLYGDEMLRPQVRAFKPASISEGLFSSDLQQQVGRARETYAEVTQVHPNSFSAFRQAPWHHFGILSLEQTQLTVRTPFLDNDLLATVFRAPEAATANNDLRVRLIGDGSQELRRIRTDRGFAGKSGGMADWFWQNYLQFTFRAEYAFDYGMPQWLARMNHILGPLRLERLFLGRHKLYHYRVWYRHSLAAYVKEMLLDSRTLSRPWLMRSRVEDILKAHMNGTHNYTTEIHRLLTMELIHRLFLDSN